MSARDVIANEVCFGHGGVCPEANKLTDAILSALSEAGFRVERLEQAGLRWTRRDELEAYHVSSAPRWRYQQDGISGTNPDLAIEPLYRIVASPVAPR